MGVIYKLTPLVRDYILEQKRLQPKLGCRQLAQLAHQQFKVPLSKSSVNALIKTSGMSMPVGRRRRARRGQSAGPGAGAIFLKAADLCMGGAGILTKHYAAAVQAEESLVRQAIEEALYRPLVPARSLQDTDTHLRFFLQDELDPQGTAAVRARLALYADSQETSAAVRARVTQAVRAYKIVFSDGKEYLIDGQCHTVWAAGANIPDAFCVPLHQARKRADALLHRQEPLVLLMAPGYDRPTGMFVELARRLDAASSVEIKTLELLGPDLRTLEHCAPAPGARGNILLGMWPWQYPGIRATEHAGGFKHSYFAPLKYEYYCSPVTTVIKLGDEGDLVLRGYSLKSEVAGDEQIAILGSYQYGQISMDNFIDKYFNQWSSFSEALQDFTKKIELFNQKTGLSENLAWVQTGFTFHDTLSWYRKQLEWFSREYFFPIEYKAQDFSVLNQRFYQLEGVIKLKNEYLSLKFSPFEQYAFLNDLRYACHRLNERALSLRGKQIWLGL